MRTIFKWVAWLLVGLVALGLIIIGMVLFLGGNTPDDSRPSPSVSESSSPAPSESPSPTPSPTVGLPTAPPTPACTTWEREDADYGNFRWFADGVEEIRNATSPEEARDAVTVWLERVKTDPTLLSATAKDLLGQDIAKDTLFDSHSCATEAAVSLYSELLLAIGQATVTPEEVPTTATNSGVDNGEVVTNAQPGISGDRASVKVVLKDGTELWVLARCGNIAVKNPTPDRPTGRTDEKPKPEPKPTPKPTPSLNKKDPAKAKPAPAKHTPAPAPAATAAETKAPAGPTVTDDKGKTTPVKPANPTVKPPAPAPSVPAPKATPVPPKPTPAPVITQAPEPEDPGQEIGDPGPPPP